MDASAAPPLGVWSTDADCYRFLAAHVTAGTRTLETGLGISTALFALLGASHRCVAPGEAEVARLQAYCAERDISLADVTFDQHGSHVALPRVSGELDLVLVDGGHAFPLPIIDWFYAGSRLRSGGLMVIDDLPLPGLQPLVRFLELDPRWELVTPLGRWAAWRRLRGGDLAEDWTEQPFYQPTLTARELVGQLAGKVRGRLGALRR